MGIPTFKIEHVVFDGKEGEKNLLALCDVIYNVSTKLGVDCTISPEFNFCTISGINFDKKVWKKNPARCAMRCWVEGVLKATGRVEVE